MNRVFKSIIYVFLSSFIFAGCSTTKALDKDTMYAMVYDLDNNAVQDVDFYIDGKKTGSTDVYGRYIIDCIKSSDKNRHELELKKSGYRTIKDTVKYETSLVLYYKTGTAEQYAKAAEKKLDEGDMDKAFFYINEASAMNESDEILYLKAIILKKQNRTDEAAAELEKIKSVTHESEYIKKFMESR